MSSKPKGFKRLRELDCFDEIHERICAGHPLEDVAQWMQEEKQVYNDVKRDSLIRQLYRYKDAIPANLIRGVRAETQAAVRRLDRIRESVDEVKELTRLYQLQEYRIARAMETEEKMGGLLLKTLRKEIEEGRNLLLNLAELKMKLGLLDEKPKELRISGSIETQEKLNQLPPDRRQALGDAAARILEAVGNRLALPESASNERSAPDPTGTIQEAEFEVVEES